LNKMDIRKIKTRLVGKDEVFQLLALGEATKLPVLLLGDPGVGKTQALLDYAAAKYNYNKKEVRDNTFVIELDEGTKTSEIKGRVNMKSLLEDKEYKIDAPIAKAKYLLINEVDKGTSGVRNTLLSVMRERALFYGDEIKKCEWDVMAGSCNVIPNDELENPFWDRFVLTQKVSRVGADSMKEIWKAKGKINEYSVEVPSKAEIETCTIEKKHMNKFLDIVYGAASDRTVYHIPFITKAIKVIYKYSDIEAILKACELIAPSKIGDLSAKLETKRENNVRSMVNSLSNVINGGNDSYSQLYIGQVADAIIEMGKVGNYAGKSLALANEVVEIIRTSESSNDIVTEQATALYTELYSKLKGEDIYNDSLDLINNYKN
tara:strand:+ start:1293 stop:2420 length:1128 start_codon:yes stop_codon:yes gene_type:complete